MVAMTLPSRYAARSSDATPRHRLAAGELDALHATLATMRTDHAARRDAAAAHADAETERLEVHTPLHTPLHTVTRRSIPPRTRTPRRSGPRSACDDGSV